MAGYFDYIKFKADGETWLRDGRADLVANRLRLIPFSRLPRAERLPIANLARRANLFSAGLKILAPIIADFDPTPQEWNEYGVLLLKNGSGREAVQALELARKGGVSHASLYLGFYYFSQWDFASAVQPISDFLLDKDLPRYQRCVGNVNLAAALIGQERLGEALAIVLQASEEAKSHNFTRLLANLFELHAQIQIQEQKFDDAKSLLEQAQRMLGFEFTSDRLWIEKWLATIHLIQQGQDEPLVQVAQRALEQNQWETLRGCDLNMLKYRGGETLFNKLYFGSPFESFRSLLLKGSPVDYSLSTDFEIGDGENLLDLTKTEYNGKKLGFADHITYRLLQVLASDFYRPFTIGSLFHEIYPNEKIDVFTVNTRVSQQTFRLRKELESHQILISIANRDGFFKLELGSGTRVRVGKFVQPLSPKESLIENLYSIFRDRPFSVAEAQRALNVSKSSIQRLIKMGQLNGQLVSINRGSNTRHQFVA